jgi:DNA helicase-4
MAVVELGNSIMEDRGTPAIAHRSDVGSVELLDMCTTELSGPERDEHKGDQITPVLLRVINAALLRGENVVLLSRRNKIAYYVNYPTNDNVGVGELEKFVSHVRSYFPENDRPRITISTAHGYKGRENEAVVIIDAKDGCYPLIHPNWKYLRIFGIGIDRVIAEERRLLYVAATRATQSVVIITSGDQKGQFIGELEKFLDIKQIDFTSLPRIDRIENHQVLIRVFNCFSVKDELKKEGFKWDPTTKAWFRNIASESFKSDEYIKRYWNIGDVLIQVFDSNMRMIWDSRVDTLPTRKNDSHTTGA